MKRVDLKIEPTERFFARGKEIAALADRGRAIPEQHLVSFEDPADMLTLLTPKRIEVLKMVKREPGSITSIADRVKRDRSGVKRDVDALQAAGIVRIREEILPGHGRQKIVESVARTMTLTAVL